MLYFLSFLALALVLCGIYAVIVLLEVPGIADERLGRLEPLPPLNEWMADEASAEAQAAGAKGLVREERVFRDPAGVFGRRLVHQVRSAIRARTRWSARSRSSATKAPPPVGRRVEGGRYSNRPRSLTSRISKS